MDKDRPDIHRHIHPPILALMFILLAYLIGRFIPAPVWLPWYVSNLGLGLIVVGFLLAAAAFWEFRKARTTLDPHGSVKALVTPFFVVAMNRLVIEKEEMYLEGKFGVEYTEYKSRVGRWW
jgi:protein-S-isoprenylcysteine O-methyltransferase Ste14